MALESIMIMSSTEAHEEHGVATINITGEYLNTKNYEYLIVLWRVRLEELMAMVDTKINQNYVTTYRNGQTFQYEKVIKALYGLLKSTLIFYKNNCQRYGSLYTQDQSI